EELSRRRREFRERLEAKMRFVRFLSEEDWLAQAQAKNIQGMTCSDDDFLIVIRAVALPSLGTYWAGLIIIDPNQRNGHAWFNEISGIIPLDEAVHVYEGDGSIRLCNFEKLLDILEKNGLEDFRDVPDRCYDGGPTTVSLCKRATGKVSRASANAGDDG